MLLVRRAGVVGTVVGIVVDIVVGIVVIAGPVDVLSLNAVKEDI
jgi:hypothetical protein